MKIYIPLVALAIFASACSSSDKKASKLDMMVAERDSLKTLQKSLSEQIRLLDEKITQSGGNKDKEGKAVLVTTAFADRGTFEHFFDVQGQIEADRSITLTAEMGGVLKRIYVQEGQGVKAGQVIAEFDREMIDQSLMEIKESTELAKFVFEKQEKLWKQNIGSELQYRQAKTNYESLLQKQRQLQTQRNKTMVTAPFSGVVNDIFLKVGEMTMPGMPVARVVNLNQLQVKAEVSESYVGKIKPGTKINLLIGSTGTEYSATLSKIGSYINPSGRTFEIAAKLPANADLLPNQVAQVKVRDYVNDDAILAPSKAILQDATGQSFVYVVQNRKDVPHVKKMIIRTGLTYGGTTEIINGLAGHEEIVVEGVRTINDGDKINIAK